MPTVISRRLSTLEDNNSDLQKQMDLLLEVAERNEGKFLWLKKFILDLIETEDLGQLDRVLHESFIESTNVDHAILYLLHHELQGKYQHLRSVQNNTVSYPGLFTLNRTMCETCREEEYVVLFEKSVQSHPSIALVPLNFKKYQGTLAIGSTDHAKFNVDVDTLFLDFLGEVLARVVTRLTS